MGGTTDLIRLTATEAVDALSAGQVTPVELIDAAAARIDAVDAAVNALPTLCFDRARSEAERMMRGDLSRRDGHAWLAGLPVAIKDLNEVAGVRTTWGSPIFADHISTQSDMTVEMIERRGGIVIAKSNTPEFGAGAQTFNEVFGATRNPWNTALTCGGSSGGAAVALATGMVWLAQGSDLGGSLRTPAGFCSVVGLRPSPGTVPRGPTMTAFDDLSVEGPMGRTVADVGLMLDAMAGPHPADPISRTLPGRPYAEAARAPQAPARVAYTPDLGFLPVDAEVREITARAARGFERLGSRVEEETPDFSGAAETFQVLRALGYAAKLARHLEAHRALLKPDVVWNTELGLKLTGEEIGRARARRSELFYRMHAFFQRYDLLVCPTAIVPPFSVEQRYVDRVGDHVFDNYIDWIGITYAITLTSCPALSLHGGFTQDGRPVGLQLVGPPRGEAALLSAAAALEDTLQVAGLTPIDPRALP